MSGDEIVLSTHFAQQPLELSECPQSRLFGLCEKYVQMIGAVFIPSHISGIVFVNNNIFFAIDKLAKVGLDESDRFAVIETPNRSAEVFFKVTQCGFVRVEHLRPSPWVRDKFWYVWFLDDAVEAFLSPAVFVEIVKTVDLVDGFFGEK